MVTFIGGFKSIGRRYYPTQPSLRARRDYRTGRRFAKEQVYGNRKFKWKFTNSSFLPKFKCRGHFASFDLQNYYGTTNHIGCDCAIPLVLERYGLCRYNTSHECRHAQ